jgi:hypothetical protein
MKKKNALRLFLFMLIASVLIACNRGYGCPGDQYNNFNSSSSSKKTKTTKDMNSNKKVKSKKPVSEKMTPY